MCRELAQDLKRFVEQNQRHAWAEVKLGREGAASASANWQRSGFCSCGERASANVTAWVLQRHDIQ